MPQKVNASAEPEKRLFISLLTRDISLADAFLDLIDNSLNSALIPFSKRLSTAKDYSALFVDQTIKPTTHIDIVFNETMVTIEDTATGIDLPTARDSVFKFGRSDKTAHPDDRLSVYGIGLKRAMFKMGDHIRMRSDHAKGGFDLDLHVARWAKNPKAGWLIPITSRPPSPKKTGTKITIKTLSETTRTRLVDGVFEGELRDKIARTYTYFLNRIVTISVNKKAVEPHLLVMGENFTSSDYTDDVVTYSITAGLAQPVGKIFPQENSGWYVFCNGRTVIFADKGLLTGWGDLLPQFQPKHRPFLGVVFFVSSDAEALPWTTTKASINVESVLWQRARREMEPIARQVLGFLDQRYTSEGTEFDPQDVSDSAGAKVTLLQAATFGERSFSLPKKAAPKETSIQYKVLVTEIDKVKDQIGRPWMPNTEVGRYTFDYFVRNEIE